MCCSNTAITALFEPCSSNWATRCVNHTWLLFYLNIAYAIIGRELLIEMQGRVSLAMLAMFNQPKTAKRGPASLHAEDAESYRPTACAVCPVFA